MSQRVLLVQTSWREAWPIADEVGRVFYDKLFELDPSLRPLFRGDLPTQQAKFMSMLNKLVQHLNNREELAQLTALGKRHIGYGVKVQDHQTLGTALIWALGQCLGERFTPEVRSAWVETYSELSQMMVEARTEKAWVVVKGELM